MHSVIILIVDSLRHLFSPEQSCDLYTSTSNKGAVRNAEPIKLTAPGRGGDHKDDALSREWINLLVRPRVMLRQRDKDVIKPRGRNDHSADRRDDDEKEENEENQGRNEYTWLSMLSVVASLPPKQIQKIDFLTNSGGSDESNAVSWIDFNGYEEIKEKIQRVISGMKKHKNIKKLDTNISHIKFDQISCKSVCGIVLYGPSGCGKTYLSRIIAAEVRIKQF